MTELQKSPQVDMKGFLLRYETFKGRSGWKKRWAVLCDFCLYLYKEQTSQECFYALLLPNSRVTQSHDSTGQYRSSIKVEEANQQPVYLSTETPLDFQQWFDALASAAQMRRLHPDQQQQQQLDVSVGQIQIGGQGSLYQQQQQQQQQQHYSIGGQSQTVVTTTQTTSTANRGQQQQQQYADGYGAGFEVSSRNHQYDYRDEGGEVGEAAATSATVRLSNPTLATAEGQYNFRQQYTVQQQPIVAASTTVTTTTVERSQAGSDQQQMRTMHDSMRSANGNGIGVSDGNIQRTVERVQYNAQYGGGDGGVALVRAEPIVPATAATTSRTGRYEMRAEVHSQQQQQQQGRGIGGGYGMAGIAGGSLGASNFSISRRAIETVREDPQMDDSEVIATAPLDEIKRKYPVSGLAKRMSIAASDLLGKSHDELLLLLIQLNREKASLERRRDYYLALLRRQPDMRGADRMQADLREIDNQIELHDPLITFINNIISMGALYNGDDVMFASEYRQHLLQPGEVKQVKANVGFLRRQQEREVARQFSGQSSGVDSVDADILAGASLTISGAPESREFVVTRQQLEAELNELETVYAEHRRRKTNLAAFMSDLGRRTAVASAGKSFVSIGGQQQVSGSSGSYLETDLDTGATIDLAAKFPQRRTAVSARGSAVASVSTTMRSQQQQQQQRSRTMPTQSRVDANGIPLRASASVTLDRQGVSSVSDDVFTQQHQQRQQQQQQQQQQSSSSNTQRTVGGGIGGYEVTATKTTSSYQRPPPPPVPQQQQQQQILQQQQYGVTVVETSKSYTTSAAPTAVGGGNSVTLSGRIPDPDEFLRERTARLSSTSGGSGLPPGQPPPEVYVSQPQLYQGYAVSRASGGVGGDNHTVSMQEKLNLALGIDSLDSPVGRQAARPTTSAAATLGSAGTKKPLISLDASRYKRNTNYSANLHGDHRNEALDNLGQFVEDMKGLQRGTYQRVDH